MLHPNKQNCIARWNTEIAGFGHYIPHKLNCRYYNTSGHSILEVKAITLQGRQFSRLYYNSFKIGDSESCKFPTHSRFANIQILKKNRILSRWPRSPTTIRKDLRTTNSQFPTSCVILETQEGQCFTVVSSRFPTSLLKINATDK